VQARHGTRPSALQPPPSWSHSGLPCSCGRSSRGDEDESGSRPAIEMVVVSQTHAHHSRYCPAVAPTAVGQTGHVGVTWVMRRRLESISERSSESGSATELYWGPKLQRHSAVNRQHRHNAICCECASSEHAACVAWVPPTDESKGGCVRTVRRSPCGSRQRAGSAAGTMLGALT